jgi:hypothetical protein
MNDYDDELGYYDTDESYDDTLYFTENISAVNTKTYKPRSLYDLPVELLDLIYLNLDIDSLSDFCNINKFNHNLCQNKNIWIDKFNHDNLPLPAIIPNSYLIWLKEYKKTLLAYNILLLNEIESLNFPTVKGLIIQYKEKYGSCIEKQAMVIFLLDKFNFDKDITVKDVIDYQLFLQKKNNNYLLRIDIKYDRMPYKDSIETLITENDSILLLKKLIQNKKLLITDNISLPYTISDIDYIFNDNILFYNLDKRNSSMNSIKLLNMRKKWILEHPYSNILAKF